MILDDMIEKLKSMITQKKFIHSLAVRDSALKLAEHYNADREKAVTAGLVHDCAKTLPDEELLNLAHEFGILIDDIQKTEVNILHAPVGAQLAQKEFGINDEEILTAIKYHTTGCENMDLMTKILYTADYIAEGRHFPEVETLRKIAFIDLDAAVIMGMDLTIQHVISKNGLIHPDTVNARNSMLIAHKGLNYRTLI